MTDRKAKVKLIKKAFKKWTERLGLRWWEMELVFYDDPGSIVKEFGQFGNDVENNWVTLARCYASWKYSKATIIINLPAWDDVDDEKVDQHIVHELMHVLVNEMREDDIHHEERVVTQLTKAIFWVDAAADRDAKKGKHE